VPDPWPRDTLFMPRSPFVESICSIRLRGIGPARSDSSSSSYCPQALTLPCTSMEDAGPFLASSAVPRMKYSG